MTIENVVQRQFNFQKNIKSNQGIMLLALVEELGEFVASTGYADWKKTARDEKNMDIELIDIAIFAINLAYYTDKIKPPIWLPQPKTELKLVQTIIAALGCDDWMGIAYTVFNYKPELLKVVVAKQALNQLRQDYGYKQGEYIKDWNGDEDNTYLEGFYGEKYEDVYNGMEEIYTVKIIGSRLVDV